MEQWLDLLSRVYHFWTFQVCLTNFNFSHTELVLILMIAGNIKKVNNLLGHVRWVTIEGLIEDFCIIEYENIDSAALYIGSVYWVTSLWINQGLGQWGCQKVQFWMQSRAMSNCFYRILYNFLGRELYFKFKRIEWRDIFHPNQPNFRKCSKNRARSCN